MENYDMSSQPQQNNPVTPDDLYAANINEERVKNLIEQISPENQLMDLQWRIKGYIKNIFKYF